jgi:hypothetical protein
MHLLYLRLVQGLIIPFIFVGVVICKCFAAAGKHASYRQRLLPLLGIVGG